MKHRLVVAMFLLGLAAAAGAQNAVDMPAADCVLCQLNLRLGFEFMVGLALLGSLVWLLQWMETSTLPVIAEHLFGVTIVGFVLFLFLRFLSP